jgi:membrane protease YdiL (CAAX protease family)
MTDNPEKAGGFERGQSGGGDSRKARAGERFLTPFAGLSLTAISAVLFFGGGAALAARPAVWSLVLLPPLAFLLPALLFARLARAGRRTIPSAPVGLRSASGAVVALLGASLLALALAGAVARWAGPDAGEKDLWRWVMGFGPWGRVCLLAVLPGLCEELFFRGALLACLRSWSPVAACLASGCLFAVFHGSLPRLLPVAVLGAALAAVVWLTQNVWIAVAGHVFHNLLVLAALQRYGVSTEPGDAALALWGLGGAVLLVGGLWRLSTGVRREGG